jgi:hypothetical protein
VFDCRLIHSSWLRRVIEVSTPDGKHVIEYNGRGFGCETVYVDSRLASRKTTWLWFAPCFQVFLGRYRAHIGVRVWPWLTIHSFLLFIEGKRVFDEQSNVA